MSYIREIPLEEAGGALREIYDAEIRESGYVANDTLVMSLRPDVLVAFNEFKRRIRSHMRLRRYELVTLASAAAIGCKY